MTQGEKVVKALRQFFRFEFWFVADSLEYSDDVKAVVKGLHSFESGPFLFIVQYSITSHGIKEPATHHTLANVTITDTEKSVDVLIYDEHEPVTLTADYEQEIKGLLLPRIT